MREIGILTDTAVSPSLRRRQPSSRYAIHAGRNLPDKEFRSVVPCCFQRPGLYLDRSEGLVGPERKVSEGSRRLGRAFPADYPRVRRIFTAGFGPSVYRSAVEDLPAYG